MGCVDVRAALGTRPHVPWVVVQFAGCGEKRRRLFLENRSSVICSTPVFPWASRMDIEPTAAGIAWFCIALPLFVTVFFRFNRVWSLRNLDLALLSCVAAGVAMNRWGRHWAHEATAVALLVIASGLLLVRLLFDAFLAKRPRIESNLSPGALGFLGVCLFAVLTIAMIVVPLPESSKTTMEEGSATLKGEVVTPDESGKPNVGPATKLLGGGLSQQVAAEPEGDDAAGRIAAGILAGLGHVAVLAALFVIGLRHFQNGRIGLAMAVAYLLLPSTILDPNSVSQVLSAAWILWALALHRIPWASGVLMGLACGSLLYPAMLLPLWLVYYGRKGAWRFSMAMLGVWGGLLGGIAMLSPDALDYVRDSLQLIAEGAAAIVRGDRVVGWSITDESFRAPIIGSFAVMLIAVTVWPRVKRFEHLLAGSAAIIVSVQFWYPQKLDDYLTGFLPLVVLVAFRPRLSQPASGAPVVRRADAAHARERTQLEPALTGANGTLLR